jgi:diaminohydroxyphosphoribosylaminopyrimidine deaminase/5-amino-6-(5-phosphoribosylamino)uracil reductase
MTMDEEYMMQCLQLAKQGKGHVAPNPMVGSVVVYQNEVIGSGFHQIYGGPHAEVNAISAVVDQSLLSKSTIYINLEPCAHFGKTPPCADLIIASNIPRVVVGCIDSYSEVAGKGIEKMRAAGIEVMVGVLEEECLELNRRFFTFHNQKRPYVILKWAQSADGFMDVERGPKDLGVKWLTQPETKKLVHQWRHEEAGILVGKNTIHNDNPQLTCREFEGNSPVRLVIDPKMRLDFGAYHVGDRSVQTYILTERDVVSSGKLKFVRPSDFSIQGILAKLYELQIQSILVEGGKKTLENFIDSGIWDEARILTGTSHLNQGIEAPKLAGALKLEFNYGIDQIKIIKHD